ncbi:MAG: hypothetical protein GF308_05875 [Candidatus Heimdallarchaeota archaeon]|nr:hypothetical protein [Candidatus Heimdallarchaeota archaeon]
MTPSKNQSVKIQRLWAEAPERYQAYDPTTLSSEKFESLLPDFVPRIIKEDIAHYFHYLRNNRKRSSLKAWEKASGCIDSPHSWKTDNYRPVFSFLYYDRLTNGQFLPLLLSKFESAISVKNQQMTVEQFNQLCRLSVVGFRPRIDAISLKILLALSQNPSLVTQELVEITGHSYVTIYNRLKQLRAKLGLRVTTRINWRRLGVQRFFLITQQPSLFSSFKDFSQFLDGKATFLWGENNFLHYYLIPHEVKDRFLKAYRSVSTTSTMTKCYHLQGTPIMGYSFDLFDVNEQKWHFDFATAFLQPMKSSSKIRQVFTEEKYGSENPYEPTTKEIKVMEGLLRNYSLTQKELANLLQIHEPNLSIIKSKLSDEQIIAPQLMLRLGLPLNCFLRCTPNSDEILQTLINLMQKIPFFNLSVVNACEEEPLAKELICFLQLDDILYYSLVTFLRELSQEQLLREFKIGLLVDSFFGESKVKEVLKETLIEGFS